MEETTILLKVPDIDYNSIPGKVVYEAITGSYSQNLATRSSDIQLKGVFVASEIDVFSGNTLDTYKVNSNIIYYELTHFVKLLQKGDLEAIEMIHIRKEYVRILNPIFEDMIIKKKDIFITSNLFNKLEKFLHHSVDTMIVDTSDKKEAKSLKPIDFISYLNQIKYTSEPLKDYLYRRALNVEQSDSKYAFKRIPNMPNVYYMYYDVARRFCTGVIIEENQLVESNNIPDTEKPVGIVYFNKAKYIEHVNSTGAKVIAPMEGNNSIKWRRDTKNKNLYYDPLAIAECMRYIVTYIEYLDSNKLKVFRSEERSYILNIKLGKIILDHVTEDLKYKAKLLKKLYNYRGSDVRDRVSDLYASHILVDIRKRIYAQEIALRKRAEVTTRIY